MSVSAFAEGLYSIHSFHSPPQASGQTPSHTARTVIAPRCCQPPNLTHGSSQIHLKTCFCPSHPDSVLGIQNNAFWRAFLSSLLLLLTSLQGSGSQKESKMPSHSYVFPLDQRTPLWLPFLLDVLCWLGLLLWAYWARAKTQGGWYPSSGGDQQQVPRGKNVWRRTNSTNISSHVLFLPAPMAKGMYVPELLVYCSILMAFYPRTLSHCFLSSPIFFFLCLFLCPWGGIPVCLTDAYKGAVLLLLRFLHLFQVAFLRLPAFHPTAA